MTNHRPLPYRLEYGMASLIDFSIQTNSVEPDQTAPKGAILSGFTLITKETLKRTNR